MTLRLRRLYRHMRHVIESKDNDELLLKCIGEDRLCHFFKFQTVFQIAIPYFIKYIGQKTCMVSFLLTIRFSSIYFQA